MMYIQAWIHIFVLATLTGTSVGSTIARRFNSNDSSVSSTGFVVASNPSTTPGPSLTSSVAPTSTEAHDGSSAFELSFGPTEVLTYYECSSSDLVQASACSSSWVSWSTASAAFIQAHGTVYTTTTAFPSPRPYNGYTSVLGRPENETTPYATCNGIPRYHGGWTSTGEILLPTVTTNITVEILATSTPTAFQEPQPSCCIGSNDCFTLQQEWHAINELLYPFNNTISTWLNGPPIDYPHCETELEEIFGTSGGGDCSGCWISGANAHLYYWPQVIEEPPLCPDSYVFNSSTTTTPHHDFHPVTAVLTYNNPVYYPNITTTTTLTSPTIYLSVQDLQGRDGCHDFVGGPFPGTLFALGPQETQSALMTFPGMTDAAASSSFASIIAHQETDKYTDLFGIGYETIFHTRPMVYPIVTQLVDINMADLGRPPPYLSYFLGDAGSKCIQGNNPEDYFPCGTIFDKYITPDVRLGTAVRSFRKDWATCNLAFGFDPPIALSPASSVAAFSFPSPESTMTSASTTFTAESALAPDTAVPQSTPNPNTAAATASGTHATAVSTHESTQESASPSPDTVSSLQPAPNMGEPATQSSGAGVVVPTDWSATSNAATDTGNFVTTLTEIAQDGSSATAIIVLAPPPGSESQEVTMNSGGAEGSTDVLTGVETNSITGDEVIPVTEIAPNGATLITTLTIAFPASEETLNPIDSSSSAAGAQGSGPDPQTAGKAPGIIHTLTEVGGDGRPLTTILTLESAPAAETPLPNAPQSGEGGEAIIVTEIRPNGATVTTTLSFVGDGMDSPTSEPGETADPDSGPQSAGSTPGAIYTFTEVGQNGNLLTTTFTFSARLAETAQSNGAGGGEVTITTEIIQAGSTIPTTFTLAPPSTAETQAVPGSSVPSVFGISIAAESMEISTPSLMASSSSQIAATASSDPSTPLPNDNIAFAVSTSYFLVTLSVCVSAALLML